MKAFYTHLADGSPAAEALALAKRDLIRKAGEDAAPLAWAGFELLGNGDATLGPRQATPVRAASIQ
jgi:CHAT domain-containing protein